MKSHDGNHVLLFSSWFDTPVPPMFRRVPPVSHGNRQRPPTYFFVSADCDLGLCDLFDDRQERERLPSTVSLGSRGYFSQSVLPPQKKWCYCFSQILQQLYKGEFILTNCSCSCSCTFFLLQVWNPRWCMVIPSSCSHEQYKDGPVLIRIPWPWIMSPNTRFMNQLVYENLHENP